MMGCNQLISLRVRSGVRSTSFAALTLISAVLLYGSMLQSVSAATHTWTGAVNSSWSEANNWNPSGVPVATDVVIFDGGTSNATCSAAAGSIAQGLGSLTVGNSYSGTITLAVNFAGGNVQTLSIVGAFSMDSGTMIVTGNSTNGEGVVFNAGSFALGSAAVLHSDGRGYPIGQGPGGTTGSGAASHGGRGGGLAPIPYGSATSPITLGSGALVGAGGGAIKINVGSNAMNIDGIIRVNGGNSTDNNGPGSAGSIWLLCGAFSGNGTIQASGGNGKNDGSGGGRIAINFSSTTFSGIYNAAGGVPVNGNAVGKAGTLQLPAGTDLTVKKDVGLAPATHTLGTVIVQTGNTLLFHGTQSGSGTSATTVAASLNASSVLIQGGAFISSNTEGFNLEDGPGAGSGNAGGSHGGRGGSNGTNFEFGSATDPITHGSGAQKQYGGGAIIIDVGSGSLQVDGDITANGGNSADNNGGGAGGSINIRCGTFSGSGKIWADGGVARINGGGGGRVAVRFTVNTFSGSYGCAGGIDYDDVIRSGRAGTLHLPTGTDLTVDHDVGLSPAAHTLGQVVVESPSALVFHATQTGSGSTATPTTCSLTGSSLLVENGALLDANLEGFRFQSGPGLGGGTGSAASHGGRGGNGLNPYGSTTNPVTLGSGNLSAFGGGLVRVDVGTGSFTLDGTATANGGSTPNNHGGGAGGSILFSCGTFGGAATGLMQARGGNGNLFGGGGGRISVHYSSSSYLGSTDVSGGLDRDDGSANGDKGSVTPGNLLISDHTLAQVTQLFPADGSFTDLELYGFSLTTNGNNFTQAFESVQVNRLVFDLIKTGGVLPGEIKNVRVFIDSNNDGSSLDEATPIPSTLVTVNVSVITGTITIDFADGALVVDGASTTRNYILRADVDNLASGDRLPVQLTLDDTKIVASGVQLKSLVTAAHGGANTGFAMLAAGAGGIPTKVDHNRPGNTPPASADDGLYVVLEDSILTVLVAQGVLANDGDANCDAITAVLITPPSNGTLVLNPDGSFTYDPNTNYVGLDSFVYAANDTLVNGNSAVVNIQVTTDNDAPVAFNDSFSVENDGVLVVTGSGVLGNDTDVENDPLTAVLLSGPANGTLVLNSDGTFSYTPQAGFVGFDTFTYAANDAIFNSNIATVTIQVFPGLNANPVGTPTVLVVGESTTLSSAPVGGSGTYLSFDWTGPNGFVSSVQNPGSIKFTQPGFNVYTLTVTDSLGFVDTAIVSIAVLGSALVPNPTASPELLQLGSSTVLSSQPVGGSGVYTSYFWTGPNGYTSTLQNPGAVSPQTPGAHTYTVTVTDASGLTATASVSVIVGEPMLGLEIAEGGARYKVSSASTSDRPLDSFKVVIRGLEFSPGDRIALIFNGVKIGDLSNDNGLTLDGKLKGRGQLISGSEVFTHCVAKYKKRPRKLTFIARKGVTATKGQPLVQAQSGTSSLVPVAILVDRAPADGIVDTAALVLVAFRVKVNASGAGKVVEKGRSRRR